MSTGGRAPDWLVVYAKRMFMGAADAVPGVSGGTIALITGIYERLIAAITALDPAVLRYLPWVHRRTERAELRSELVGMDVPFLIALGAGVVTALVTVARVELPDLGPSFYEMATHRMVPFDPQLTVCDVVGDCDLPHLLAALEQRGISIDRGAGKP